MLSSSIGRRAIRLVLYASLTLLLVAGMLAGAALGGPLEDAEAAFDRDDYATALQLLRPLADGGNSVAQENLGIMYYSGRGVPQDYAEAARWYRKAANQGNADAQINLGLMYKNGQGVSQSNVEAHKWFNLAASRNPTSEAEMRDRDVAAGYRDQLASKMTIRQITEAQKLAAEWKSK